ncbi:hypothetical protein N7489_004399 [Penicillium chrysogenum]|uniref:uncharacterized protein n=1 Tax=Penicillium chrysogenum TaxID=5076 RepID=UPI0024DF0B02|nr:uncharacterized protein N7489_004399 [Penicillium chrysogenum]KAJ5244303.1 hypothetical protein N7489_004399 [Penicillium chrysogenum]
MADYCGCSWNEPGDWQPQYLPQVSLKAHATILSSAARTTLTQTFVNPSSRVLKEVFYNFPLYDGVSVVGFECKVGSRLLYSKVKTKSQADADYQNAVAQQQTAAVMDHTSMNDVFVIRLGNLPAHGKINVDITFVGELKQDSQTDGIRYTLPSKIAPRYGNTMSYSQTQLSPLGVPASLQGMSVTVDVQLEKGLVIRELESPSHRVKVSLGRVSSTPETSAFEPSQASASVIPQQNNTVLLEEDFVVLVKADGHNTPSALLERHPTLPNQCALMATLVPKFNLRPASPEVVFVIDRSGSMESKIPTLKSALQVFLKSLPVGICFNICSFGSYYSVMWPTSQVYDASSLNQALAFVDTVYADMGGTEMKQAVVATVQNRLNFEDLDVLILTDGQIFDQDQLFNFVRERAADNTARFFSLGIGEAASHSLIEGIARAGNGFCQSVTEYETLDRKIVRMLKGALTPHVHDYKLEVEYDTETEPEFEFVSDTEDLAESETEVEEKSADGDVSMEETTRSSPQPISLYDENFQEDDMDVAADEKAAGKLPTVTPPRAIQAPYNIPPLYPFIRTNVFFLMDPSSSEKIPKSLKLSATSNDGPLQLRIPICDIGTGETIHQLASRKAMIELEEGHGWLSHAKDENRNKFKRFHNETKKRLAELECQRLGIKFQVTGKYCSFVALEECSSSSSAQRDERHSTKEHAVEQISPLKRPATLTGVPRFMSVTAPARTGGVRHGGARHGGARDGAARDGGIHYGGYAAGVLGGGRAMQMQQTCLYSGSASLSASLSPSMPPGGQPIRTSEYGPTRGSPEIVGQYYAGSQILEDTTPLFKSPQMRIHELIQLQTFEGSWMWDVTPFELLGHHSTVIRYRFVSLYSRANRLTAYGFSPEEQKVQATLVVLAWLMKRQLNLRGVWELVHDKGAQWVRLELQRMQKHGLPGAFIASIQDQVLDMV